MTEDQAKTKWCPMVRNGNAGTIFHDSKPDGVHSITCIGSACMMWREHKKETRYSREITKEMAKIESWTWDDNLAQWTKQIGEEGGYCGLAGKP